jgi:hypothetical protein
LNVPLDVTHHVVLIQVRREVADKVEAIAHVDERARVGELRLHEENLSLLWVVKVALAGDALHLLYLPRLRRSLDILKVCFGVLAGGYVGTQVKEQTLLAPLGVAAQISFLQNNMQNLKPGRVCSTVEITKGAFRLPGGLQFVNNLRRGLRGPP